MTDLHVTEDRPTSAEQRAVDAVVAPAEAALIVEGERLVRGGRARRLARRHLLLPTLRALQREIGWISPGALNHVATQLQVPPAEAYGVATFYDLLRTEDPGHDESVAHVCLDAACQIKDSDGLAQDLAAQGRRVHRAPCLGQCERAPAVFVQGRGEPDRVPADAAEVFSLPQQDRRGLRLLRRVGLVDPSSLGSYRANGGYEALERSLEMGAEAVIDAVSAAGLVGRGGAAFPTGTKWRGVANQEGRPKHVVANCDESEPGTFKDRIVMEHDPFAVVEAMTIAGLATGAENGWLYIRGEYPRSAERMRHAVAAARDAGLLGSDVAGSGQRFDIEVRRGAGAYICGEETALFNSIEGYRGEPRNKPPFPTTHGLFGQPTAINNPETLLNVLDILVEGPDAYRSVGTADSPGTKLFCLSGTLARPGLYEVAFGTRLGDLLDLAGATASDLQAVLMGGVAGSFVGPEQFDLALTFEDARAAATTLGSGVIMAFDTSIDMGPVITRIAEFFRHESCGQCVPCRIGTVRQHEVLVQLQATGGPLAPHRVELIDDMARAMGDASICGLGHTASGAVQSALRLGLIGGGHRE